MKNTRWILAFLVLAASCGDLRTSDTQRFVIRGRAMTGLRTRSALSKGYVSILIPGSSGWTTTTFSSSSLIPNKATTNTDGTFTFTAPLSILDSTSGIPIFIAATDASQTFTMTAEIPKDLVKASAQLTLDINPSTTAAGALVCPGGKYPPPTGAYCWSDPTKTASYDQSLVTAIDSALNTTLISLTMASPPVWSSFLSSLLSDATTLSALKNALTSAGFTSTSAFTASNVSALTAASAFSKITAPVFSTDSNDPNPPSSDSSTVIGTTTSSCKATWRCTSASCAAVMGGTEGTVSGFKSSSECLTWCQTYIPGSCSCSGC